MNPAMYSHPAVQANIECLRARGAVICGPATGETACGEQGLGRLLEPDAIIEQVAGQFYRQRSRRVLITLGPTRSRLDPVRYLTNRSSGLMGAALAWAARREGYQVTIIAGPCDAPLPRDAKVLRVQTAAEMLHACEAEFAACDVFASAAAVLDWEVAQPAATKLKKEQGAPEIRFERSPDVLSTLAARKRAGQFVLGFAAETERALEEGVQKRLRKHCDALFANDVSLAGQGFESTVNGGWWIGASGEIYELSARPKTEIAALLIGLIDGNVPPGLRGKNMDPQSVPHPARAPLPHTLSRPDDTRVV